MCGAVPSTCPTGSQTLGAAISPSGGFTGGGLFYPTGIAIDTTSGVAWVSNTGTGGVSRIDSSGQVTGPYSGGGQENQQGIAVDPFGNVWVANDDSVTELNSAGVLLAGPITGGGIGPTSGPYGLAIDGAGNVWVNNYNGNSITELAPDGTVLCPSGGFTAGGVVSLPQNAIRVDASGNVWAVIRFESQWKWAVVQFIGAATPVQTPLLGRPVTPTKRRRR